MKRLWFPLAVALLLMLGLGLLAPDWTRFLMTQAIAKGLVVLGVVLLMHAGLVSFGQGLFYAASAYLVGFAMQLWGVTDGILLTIAGTLLSMILAAMLGLLIARYREIFFAMLTLAFTMALWGVLQKSTGVTGGDDGMGILQPTFLGYTPSPTQMSMVLYLYTLAWAAIMLFLVFRYLDSPLGYVVRAVRDNEVRVEYLGMSVHHTIYVTYVLAAGLSGIGGALVAFNVGHITPELAYWATSGSFVSVALLGGSGHVLAPFLGSLVFELLRSEAASRWPEAWQLTMGFLMLAVILFMPNGLWTIVDAAWERVRR
ncbi:MAG: branched-chain amino acid ABC transporter permease [Chloroflexi bacterium]|nr:MAG: branched-chain amino acid ABC transporter permease [Chloroflexota bacterium]